MIVSGQEVIEWMEAMLGERFHGEAIGMGLKSDGRFVAGAAYHGRQYHNVNASIVALPGSLTRPFIRAIHDYPFNALEVKRISVCVRLRNQASAKLAERLGFKYEGCQRAGYPDGEDKLMFGMLRKECKWIF